MKHDSNRFLRRLARSADLDPIRDTDRVRRRALGPRLAAWLLALLVAGAVLSATAPLRADVGARTVRETVHPLDAEGEPTWTTFGRPSESGPSTAPDDDHADGLAPLPPAPFDRAIDSDGDGISDRTERRSGTDPFDADTDSDGVADGDEDFDRDGMQDAGERDPRTPGLHHGAAHLPEPMVFDLVRSLGAREGELEANTLIVVDLHPDRPIVSWAPEVEWAIVDDFAVEIELPMVDAELHALKAAAQLTLPSPDPSFAHGTQVIAEVFIAGWTPELTALYLLGGRMGPLTVFGMVGLRTRTPSTQRQDWDLLVNPTVSVDLHETVTVGVESNVAVGLDESVEVRLIPQIAWQVARRFRVQVGGGVTYAGGAWSPLVAGRVILE